MPTNSATVSRTNSGTTRGNSRLARPKPMTRERPSVPNTEPLPPIARTSPLMIRYAITDVMSTATRETATYATLAHSVIVTFSIARPPASVSAPEPGTWRRSTSRRLAESVASLPRTGADNWRGTVNRAGRRAAFILTLSTAVVTRTSPRSTAARRQRGHPTLVATGEVR